jgi:hypothetical protein
MPLFVLGMSIAELSSLPGIAIALPAILIKLIGINPE